MERMTLREAAARTSRSVTTLRRYIRSGRLSAEKRFGRFGPEYYVSERDLESAGLDTSASPDEPGALVRRPSAPPARRDDRPAAESVPLGLFTDLQMKHEQLLVQYGMVRAGGLRTMELQARLDARSDELTRLRAQVERERRESRRRLEEAQATLREAQLELEGRGLEIEALREKVRGLEMVGRSSAPAEPIEKQFDDVMSQSRRVEEMERAKEWTDRERDGWPFRPPSEPADH